MAGQVARVYFTIIHRPGWKHTNADTFSHYSCWQCGRESHLIEQIISIIEVVCGYSSQDMHKFLLNDNYVYGPHSQSNRNKLPDLVKGQSLEYPQLLQQWDQLVVRKCGPVEMVCAPNNRHRMNGATWHQLVVPSNLYTEVFHETHQGACGGHLGQDTCLNKFKNRFNSLIITQMLVNWCQTCPTCVMHKIPTPR